MDHDILPPKLNYLRSMFKIIYSSSDSLKIKIAEAIAIKRDEPVVNVKHNELYNFLKLF